MQPPHSDPFSSLPRLANLIHSLWLRYTYPFASCGANFRAHFSCDIRRPMVRHISIGNDIWLDRDVWLNVPVLPESRDPVIVLCDGCMIGRRCMISAKNLVSIGAGVIFGPSVLVTDHLHEFADTTVAIGEQGVTPGGTVRIEEGCWVGAGAAIIASRGDLVIGRNCIVGANAVVTRSVPAYSVVAGNPAHIVRQYSTLERKWVSLSSGAASTSEPVAVPSYAEHV